MKYRRLVNKVGMEQAMIEFLLKACHDKAISFKTEPFPRGEENFGVNTGLYVRTHATDLTLYYNIKCLFDNTKNGMNFVGGDMNKRNKNIRNFSRITKILLHELGHLATAFELYGKNGENWYTYNLRKNKCRSQQEYVNMEDEYKATEWALNWIDDPINRKIARRFEKEFWACFVDA
jgi:hypothetical protein